MGVSGGEWRRALTGLGAEMGLDDNRMENIAMSQARSSITHLGLVVLLAACSSGAGNAQPTGSSGSGPGKSGGFGGSPSAGGMAGGTSSGSSGTSAAGGGASPGAGTAGVGLGLGGTSSGGQGAGGVAGLGGSGASVRSSAPPNVLVTSSANGYWKAATWAEVSSGTAIVTVNEPVTFQKWEGFGAAFSERGWSYLTSKEMQDRAMTLLFSGADGAAFDWGLIPMGASAYAISRYTLDDTGPDVTPDANGANRPLSDEMLSKFSLERDRQALIPYVKAAQAVNPALRFWASPWTPPPWMKVGYLKDSTVKAGDPASRPSYFDGGSASANALMLKAYALYYTKFIQGYQAEGIKIELVSPQNQPGLEQNYPSCSWDKLAYTNWVGKFLGPAMISIGVKVMLGTLASYQTDPELAAAVLADPHAKSFVSVIGAEWSMLEASQLTPLNSALPVWATEHRCGNYPFCLGKGVDGCPAAYNSSQAPNDQAYGEESWGYIRDAITKVKVTAYHAANMVLDKDGLGNDTTREWKQNALLVAGSGKVEPTPAYYVFRHLSQYVVPGATVIGTSGTGDAIAFRNPDRSFVVVMFNSGAANDNYSVSIDDKLLQFAMPASGWATLKYTP